MNINGACRNPAPGGPGSNPFWTRSDKDGIGTAYSSSSSIWFTVSGGILNEIYYPTIDQPQIRDMQYLVTDGETFFHEERRDTDSTIECLAPGVLGLRIVNSDREGRYTITKEIISDPHQPCLLVRTTFTSAPEWLGRLRLYVLCAPHLDDDGWDDNGRVVVLQDRTVLMADDGGLFLALGASIPFTRCSCGYVGVNDGWTDLSENFTMDYEFDYVDSGHIALTGELPFVDDVPFTLALAFHDGPHGALMTLAEALGISYQRHRDRFVEQWRRTHRNLIDLSGASFDDGALYRQSHSLLLAHEDKLYAGATIASLSIPWGESRAAQEATGGYLVWTRDMVQSATGLIAAGSTGTAVRALIYLACAQRPDGGFNQNTWISGEAYWHGVQLDESAFPIILARHLHSLDMLDEYNPYPMVMSAAAFLIRMGPATPQERWEENSGLSPSTLAAHIAGLVCAAAFASERGDHKAAQFILEYADFLEEHIERWTVTTNGTLVPGMPRHYIRITPADIDDIFPNEDPNNGVLQVRNRPGWVQQEFPANSIIDGGFLELVRYGVRAGGDPIMEDSVRVIDEVLKVETPFGPCWRRYNYDGYGQRDDGGPFDDWGVGRAWPLLSGERGHYELAAGRDVAPYLRSIESFAHGIGLLPEQVWDVDDLPEAGLYRGRSTGSAMPLCWAHAEYIKLLRSARDGRVFDVIPEVAERYLNGRQRQAMEVWKFNRQVPVIAPGVTLRIQADARFTLRWTNDEWATTNDTTSTGTSLGIDYVDIQVGKAQRAPVRFTFRWGDGKWEGKDYCVEF